VIDTSAILAVVFEEPGAERVDREIRDDSVVLSVNLAEVVSRMVDEGSDEAEIRRMLDGMGLEVVPFDEEFADRHWAALPLGIQVDLIR